MRGNVPDFAAANAGICGMLQLAAVAAAAAAASQCRVQSVARDRVSRWHCAGSERQKTSGAVGERLKEASSINKSLSTLGLVINKLVEAQDGGHRHIPYRDSRLTFLLQVSTYKI